jgi:hypothetical protein
MDVQLSQSREAGDEIDGWRLTWKVAGDLETCDVRKGDCEERVDFFRDVAVVHVDV